MGQGARLCEQGNDALIGKNLKGQRLILLAHVPAANIFMLLLSKTQNRTAGTPARPIRHIHMHSA